jgi:hypothetical protein
MGLKDAYKLLSITALTGWLPIGIGLLVAKFALEHGARDWPDLLFHTVFIGLWLALTGVGVWVAAKLDMFS